VLALLLVAGRLPELPARPKLVRPFTGGGGSSSAVDMEDTAGLATPEDGLILRTPWARTHETASPPQNLHWLCREYRISYC